MDKEELQVYINSVKEALPALEIALIQPKKDTEYGSIISLMDEFKKAEIHDLGVSPL